MSTCPAPDPNAHVMTVRCPECGVSWTGHFMKPPTEAHCRKCARHLSDADIAKHPDLTIRKGF